VETHAGGTDLPKPVLTRLWTDLYCWIHQPWAPTSPRAEMDAIFADITDSMNLPASRIAIRGDRPVAAAFVVPHHIGLLVIAETATPDEPDGRQLVAGLLGHTLSRIDTDQATIDGHLTDPHLWPVAATIPHRLGRTLLLVQAPP